VLEDGCLAGTEISDLCDPGLIKGTLGPKELRLRILDGGEFDLRGLETWDVQATAPLSCLGVVTVDSCETSSLYSTPFLFSISSTDHIGPCTANACGFCDCTGRIVGEIPTSVGTWSRSQTNLTFGVAPVPYCVTGDELWIGGNVNGATTVSYKFKKQSCTGTPIPCAQRTTEQCSHSGNCFIGTCKSAAGSAANCADATYEAACNLLQDCTWDPNGCSGTNTDMSCDFDNCDNEPGCSWGPPREFCGGQIALCSDHTADDSTTPGCSVHVCGSSLANFSDCRVLSASECPNAPGCTLNGTTCTGQAVCISQTDETICSKLTNCLASPYCDGVPTHTCSDLSLDECPNELGCRLEW
jgi:hypothetical protein